MPGGVPSEVGAGKFAEKVVSDEIGIHSETGIFVPEQIPTFSLQMNNHSNSLLLCRWSIRLVFPLQSVQHENSYRDPKAKFCYGESPPDLQPVGS